MVGYHYESEQAAEQIREAGLQTARAYLRYALQSTPESHPPGAAEHLRQARLPGLNG